jgi:hypothetical protein
MDEREIAESLDDGFCPPERPGRTGILDKGFWILDAGYWILDAGNWILDSGYWKLVTNDQ